MQQLVALSGVKIDVRNYTSDFEVAIRNACKYQFPEGNHIGCYFHFKQAVLRKMEELKFDSRMSCKVIKEFVRVLELLTIIPIDEIVPYGIPFLRSIFEVDLKDVETALWEQFWKYFKRQWLEVCPPSSWNIHNVSGKVKEFIDRTNNPCESHNSRYNGKFHTSGRSIPLLEWVKITSKESLHWEREMEDIRKGKRKRPEHKGSNIPDIPAKYIAFRDQKMSEAAEA